jgi:riboflavin synthase
VFTGIIESLGRIATVEPAGGDTRMSFVTDDGYLEGIQLGDSIAIMGVCLTANVLIPGGFVADLSAETLGATTARQWQAGKRINLERALTANKPLGGHFVSGHVDGIGTLIGRSEDARSWRLEFAAPRALSRYVARKGSITIDGVSLTVNDVDGDHFGVNIIPHTFERTTLGDLRPGDSVNLEVDLVARYLERLLAARESDRS